MAKNLQQIPISCQPPWNLPQYQGAAEGFGNYLIETLEPSTMFLSKQQAKKAAELFGQAFNDFQNKKFPNNMQFCYKQGTKGFQEQGNIIYFDVTGQNLEQMKNSIYQILNSRIIQEKTVTRPKTETGEPRQTVPSAAPEKPATPPVLKKEEHPRTESPSATEGVVKTPAPVESETSPAEEQCTLETYTENGQTVEEYYTLDSPPKLFLSQRKNGEKIVQKTEYLKDGSEKRTAYDETGSHTVVVQDGCITDAYDVLQDGTHKKLEDYPQALPEGISDQTAAIQKRDSLLEQQKNTPFISEKVAIGYQLDALYHQFPDIIPAAAQPEQADQEFFNSPGGQLFLLVAAFLSMLDEKGTNLVTTILGNATVADLAKEKENQTQGATFPTKNKERD